MALLCAALPPAPRGMLTGGEDGGYSSWVAGFLHTGHAEYTYGQQKGSNHIHKKAAGAISVCLTPPPSARSHTTRLHSIHWCNNQSCWLPAQALLSATKALPKLLLFGIWLFKPGETTGCSSREACFYRLCFCSFSFWWVCSWIFHLLFLRALMLPCFLGYTEPEKKATATSVGVCYAGHHRLMLLSGGCNRASAKLALT